MVSGQLGTLSKSTPESAGSQEHEAAAPCLKWNDELVQSASAAHTGVHPNAQTGTEPGTDNTGAGRGESKINTQEYNEAPTTAATRVAWDGTQGSEWLGSSSAELAATATEEADLHEVDSTAMSASEMGAQDTTQLPTHGMAVRGAGHVDAQVSDEVLAAAVHQVDSDGTHGPELPGAARGQRGYGPIQLARPMPGCVSTLNWRCSASPSRPGAMRHTLKEYNAVKW